MCNSCQDPSGTRVTATARPRAGAFRSAITDSVVMIRDGGSTEATAARIYTPFAQGVALKTRERTQSAELFGDGIDGGPDLLFGVCAAHKEAQARRALLHRWIDDGHDVDAELDLRVRRPRPFSSVYRNRGPVRGHRRCEERALSYGSFLEFGHSQFALIDFRDFHQISQKSGFQ